jgi:hypothetical protein
VGTGAGLLSLVASERFTNSAYDTALELVAEPEARAVIERNLGDEQHHLHTLIQWVERSQRAEELPAG